MSNIQLDRLVQMVPAGKVRCNMPGCTDDARLVVLWRGPGDGSNVMAFAEYRLHAEGVCVKHAFRVADELAAALRDVRRADGEAHLEGGANEQA